MSDVPVNTPSTQAGRTLRAHAAEERWWYRRTEGLAEIRAAILAIEEQARAEGRQQAVREIRPLLWEQTHTLAHEGDGYYESCIECMASVDEVLDRVAGLNSESGQPPRGASRTNPVPQQTASLLPEDDEPIAVVPDERREAWLTDDERRAPRRVPTTRELFDAVDRKRAEENR